MQFQANTSQLRSFIGKRVQIAFVVGFLMGIVLGWALSGVVGMAMRVGIVAILLIPFVLAIMFWWKVRQASKAPEGQSASVVTIGSTGLPTIEQELERLLQASERQARANDPDVIDLDELRREREP